MQVNSLMYLPPLDNCIIAVLGLGYVGLPVAISFSLINTCKRTNLKLNRKVIGFDINLKGINDLKL